MPTVTLREALTVLSKSSPFAVEVEGAHPNELGKYKDYLYVETDIERDLRGVLGKSQPAQIIFLCGSSGDGKSAILKRVKQKYRDTVSFHLDATHSFNPHQDAISTLDEVFAEFKTTGRPLVVGINVGMMANYAEGGSSSHKDIRTSMSNFLSGITYSQQHTFLNFEHYPKFRFDSDGIASDFVQAVLDRLIAEKDDNPFYRLAKHEAADKSDPILLANYRMLSDAAIQIVVIRILLKARLVKDQFLTARSFLDFIFYLLTARDYLYNNLFEYTDNELSRSLAVFDPSGIRTRRIDDFIVKYDLSLLDEDFHQLVSELKDKYGIERPGSAASLVRCFFILQGVAMESHFHDHFSPDFYDELLEKYSRFWKLHVHYNGSNQQRTELKRDFYTDIFFKAIRTYINRNAFDPYAKDLLLSCRGRYQVSVEVSIHPDFQVLPAGHQATLGSFPVFIRVNKESLDPIPVNANLLDLCIKITQGYRPNKHDKSSVLMLDEIVDEVLRIGTLSKTLWVRQAKRTYKVEQDEFQDISVMGA